METRKQAFRNSFVKIASRLNEHDILSVCFIHEGLINQWSRLKHDLSCPSHCEHTGLSVMGQLCAREVFSECETKPLVDLLNHIGRVDLANTFLKEYVNVQTQNGEFCYCYCNVCTVLFFLWLSLYRIKINFILHKKNDLKNE